MFTFTGKNGLDHKPAPSHPMRAARAWVRKDRRLLAEWLGFPRSTAAVNVLGGIVPKSLSIPGLLYLRNALRNPEVVSTLGRLERINADVFALFTAPELRPYLSWRLIREVSMRTESDEPERLLLFHLRAILRRAKESGCLWKIGRFESLAQVEQIGLELLWPY